MIATLPGSAADTKKKEVEAKPFVPLYQGVQVGIELSGPASYFLSDSWSSSVKADINLKNKFFPTLEAGYSDFDKTAENGIHFISSGTYLKVGLNIPIKMNGAKAENILYGGIHYGISSFGYDLENLVFSGGYWGDNNITSLTNEKATVGWAEAAIGLRIKVLGPFSLGWGIQYKSIINIKKGDNSNPPYIPGYGMNTKPGVGINAHLYYKLPF